MNIWFLLSACVLSFGWLGIHLILGGRDIARPLRQATELARVVRDTQYLCWHFTSAAIGAIAVFFLLAVWTGASAYAVSGTGLAAAFAIVGIGLVIRLKGSHLELPQGWLFVPVAVLGALGILL